MLMLGQTPRTREYSPPPEFGYSTLVEWANLWGVKTDDQKQMTL